ncbi:MAG: YaiO family outer membrane beta-barrel protein [Gammaproteobacteria bacterium]
MRPGGAAITCLLVFLPAAFADTATSDRTAQERYQQARQLSFHGKQQQALAIYRTLLAENPANADYLLAAGQAWLWDDQPDRAIPYLLKARDAAPDYEDVYRALASAYSRAGHRDKAQAVYAEAKRRFPDADWARSPALPPEHRYSVSVRQGITRLSNDSNDWRATRLTLGAESADNRKLYGFVQDSERFDKEDITLGVNGYYPVTADLVAQGELQYSSTYRVLPHYLAYAQLGYRLPDGWGILGGYKRVEYRESSINMVDLTLEKYFSDFRIAYTAVGSDSDTAGGAFSNRLQLGYYLPEQWNISLALSTGSEVEKPLSAESVVRTRFTGIALWGDYYLSRAWVLSWELGQTWLNIGHRDSNRKALTLGISYRF